MRVFFRTLRRFLLAGFLIALPSLFAGPQENFIAAMKRNNLKQAQKLFTAGGVDLNVADDKGKNAVMYACENGNAAVFLWLSENNADIKAQDSEGNNCLHMAIGARKPDPLFAAALEKGLDKNARNNHGETAFLKAAATGKKPAFEALLQSGADINLADKENQTPLLRAIQGRQYALAQSLVAAGANPNAGNRSALVLAYDANQYKLFEALVKAGANTRVNHDKSGRFLLLETVKKERIAYAKLLLESGASLDVPDENGDALPVLCVKQTIPDLIAPLIARGISIDTKDSSGKTLFLLAHENILKRWTAARAKLYRVLLENGANPNTLSSAQRSVLMEQAENGRVTETKLLLTHGADVNFRDKSNNTVLHSAALRNQLGTVGVLIEKFTDANITGDSGNTAAHFAARMGGTGILKLLKGRGANFEIKNNAAETPLSIAISRQDVQTTKALLAMGAVLSDEGRETPLMLEIAKSGTANAKTRDLLSTLTKAGASIDATNSYGNNALSYALSSKNLQMAQAFLSAGAKSEAGDARGNTLLHKVALGSRYNKLKNQELTGWINLAVSYEHPDYQNSAGETALHLAANEENNPDLEGARQFFETLVDYSASVSIPNKKGDTAYKLGKKLDWDILATANLQGPQPSQTLTQVFATPENDTLLGFVAGGNHFFAVHRYGKLTRVASLSNNLSLKREIDLGVVEAIASTTDGVLIAGIKQGAIDGVLDNKCRANQNWVVYVTHLNQNLDTRWEYTQGKTGSCQRTHALAVGYGAEGALLYAEFSGRRSVLRLNSAGSSVGAEIARNDRTSEVFPLPENHAALISQNVVYSIETGKNIGKITKTRGYRLLTLSEKGERLLASDFTKLAGRRGVTLSVEDSEGKPLWSKSFAGEANMAMERVAANNGRYCASGKTDGALHGQAHSSPGKLTNYYVFCTNALGQRLFTRLLPADKLTLQEMRVNRDGTVALAFKGGERKNPDIILAVVDKEGRVFR